MSAPAPCHHIFFQIFHVSFMILGGNYLDTPFQREIYLTRKNSGFKYIYICVCVLMCVMDYEWNNFFFFKSFRASKSNPSTFLYVLDTFQFRLRIVLVIRKLYIFKKIRLRRLFKKRKKGNKKIAYHVAISILFSFLLFISFTKSFLSPLHRSFLETFTIPLITLKLS